MHIVSRINEVIPVNILWAAWKFRTACRFEWFQWQARYTNSSECVPWFSFPSNKVFAWSVCTYFILSLSKLFQVAWFLTRFYIRSRSLTECINRNLSQNYMNDKVTRFSFNINKNIKIIIKWKEITTLEEERSTWK